MTQSGHPSRAALIAAGYAISSLVQIWGYNVESAANPASVGIYRNVCVCSRICAEEVMRAGLRGPLQECGQEHVPFGLHGKVLPNAQREEIALGFRPLRLPIATPSTSGGLGSACATQETKERAA
jgi:hypothetical protein